MKKNLAFSMVEVMITLVILGVIAVLTVPGLVDSANKRINDAAADKANYAVSQAAMRLQAECPRLRNCNNGGNARDNLINLLNGANANDMLTYYVSNKTADNKFYVFVTIKDDESFPILYEVDDRGSGARPTIDTARAVFSSAKDNGVWNSDDVTWGNEVTLKHTVDGQIQKFSGSNIRIAKNCRASLDGDVSETKTCY